jgi:putative transcriptional regulator
VTVSHHPAEDSLLDYALGKLAPGAALAVAAHLEACPHCRQEAAFLERVGGAVIAADETAALPAGALDRALAALDAPTPRPAAPPAGLPRALAGRRIGRWRWAGPGVRIAWLTEAAAAGEHLYLLKARPGVKLPRHGHHGRERVTVLAGAFLDGGKRYGPGDLCECDACDEHQPVAGPEGECVCLVATEGRLRLGGVARWLQPILGI